MTPFICHIWCKVLINYHTCSNLVNRAQSSITLCSVRRVHKLWYPAKPRIRVPYPPGQGFKERLKRIWDSALSQSIVQVRYICTYACRNHTKFWTKEEGGKFEYGFFRPTGDREWLMRTLQALTYLTSSDLGVQTLLSSPAKSWKAKKIKSMDGSWAIHREIDRAIIFHCILNHHCKSISSNSYHQNEVHCRNRLPSSCRTMFCTNCPSS
jgi:hypothetical protein